MTEFEKQQREFRERQRKMEERMERSQEEHKVWKAEERAFREQLLAELKRHNELIEQILLRLLAQKPAG